jgi:hypothetical protein
MFLLLFQFMFLFLFPLAGLHVCFEACGTPPTLLLLLFVVYTFTAVAQELAEYGS